VVFSITLLSTLSAPQNALAGAAPSCVTPPSGMVSWWPLDETSGTTSVDIQDGNDGTHINGPTPVPGKVSGGLSFDGSNDGVLIGNPANLQLQSFTFDAWIKRASTSVAGGGTGFQEGEIFVYGTNGYAFGLLGTTNELFLSKTGVNFRSGGTTITDNTNFHHVAVTKSGSTVIFYVDGVASAPIFYNPGFSFTSVVAIGAVGDFNPPASFLGIIDEMEVYNRALSAGEIQSIFNAGSAGKCKDENQRPVAVAGSEQIVPVGALVQLDGSNSFDPDDVTPNLTYMWAIVSKPFDSTATLSNPSAESPTFVADKQGAYELSLIVNDGTDDSFSDSVTVIASTKCHIHVDLLFIEYGGDDIGRLQMKFTLESSRIFSDTTRILSHGDVIGGGAINPLASVVWDTENKKRDIRVPIKLKAEILLVDDQLPPKGKNFSKLGELATVPCGQGGFFPGDPLNIRTKFGGTTTFTPTYRVTTDFSN